MIRLAAISDVPAIVEMGERFARKAMVHVGYDQQNVTDLVTGLVENENGLVLVGDGCMIGVIIYPHPFNNAHRVAQELFWYSEGREGFKLLSEAEKLLRGKCDSIVMITVETLNADRMAAFYEKRGFIPMERGFVKEL